MRSVSLSLSISIHLFAYYVRRSYVYGLLQRALHESRHFSSYCVCVSYSFMLIRLGYEFGRADDAIAIVVAVAVAAAVVVSIVFAVGVDSICFGFL